MSLRKATVSNLKWSFIESISLRLIGFILTIILARLLTPTDFGVLAVVNVFYLLTNSFIEGGLKDALLQKKDVTDTDYASVFWTNIILSVLFYVLLFFVAPQIEKFYEYENLTFYIRLQAISLVIDSMSIVQVVKSTKELDLKKITRARIPSSLISFGVGILLAYMGLGVKALIWQQLINSSMYVFFLWNSVRYIPQIKFSINSLKPLYSFGLKIFAAGYLNRMYVQSMNLIYAKYFSPAILGIYSRSNNLQQIPVSLVVLSVVSGIYPTMVLIQDDNKKLKEIYKKNVQVTLFLVCGICTVLYFQAGNIVMALLGDKWLDMIPYVKILSVGGMFMPLGLINRNIFKVKGQGGLFLKLEIARKLVMLALIFLFINQSFYATILAVTFGNIVMTLVDMYFSGIKIHYSLIEQLVDFLPFSLLIFIIGLATEFFIQLSVETFLSQLALFLLVFLIITGLAIFFFKRKLVKEVINLIK